MVLTHQGRWRKVTRSGQTGWSETVTVKGRGGSIRCTPDHQFWSAELHTDGYAPNGNHPWKMAAPEWTEAAGLLGRVWATPHTVEPLPVPIPDGWNDDDEFWWMVGRWVGDGWLSRAGASVLICCGHHESDMLETKLNDWRRTEQETTTRFRLANRPLHTWLETHFGRGAQNKSVPSWLLGAPLRIREAWMAGYVSADGWVQTRDSGTVNTSTRTVSPRLALGTRLLAATLGFTPGLYDREQTTTTIEGRPVTGAHTYRVDWTDTPAGGPYSQSFTDDLHVWGRVRSVDLHEANVPVYDLEVEDDHSFVADGFVVHNCCQRLDLADTEEDTWSITYTYGQNPPIGGIRAAAVLACELTLAFQPETVNQCRLPKRVTSITRQGVSMAILDPLTLFADGLTGLSEVDLWVSSVAVGAKRRRASVIVPGQPAHGIRRTNT